MYCHRSQMAGKGREPRWLQKRRYRMLHVQEPRWLQKRKYRMLHVQVGLLYAPRTGAEFPQMDYRGTWPPSRTHIFDRPWSRLCDTILTGSNSRVRHRVSQLIWWNFCCIQSIHLADDAVHFQNSLNAVSAWFPFREWVDILTKFIRSPRN